jgi:uncharacterized membrane protein
MPMRRRWLGLVIVAAALALSIWAYPRLPDSVPTHWNMRGQADDYSSRLVAVLSVPLGLLVLMAVFQILPRIDPKGRNYLKFQDTYWTLVNGVLGLGLGLHAMVLAVGMGAGVNVRQALGIGFGLLFMLIGNYLGRLEPNWFMGIRTPWTLSSETVWRKTHRTAAWLFVAGGVVVVLMGILRPAGPMRVLAITLAVAAGVPVVQSYVLWRREKSK